MRVSPPPSIIRISYLLFVWCIFWLYIWRMSAVEWPYVSRMSAVCGPYVGRISAVCQPYLISQFAYIIIYIHTFCVFQGPPKSPSKDPISEPSSPSQTSPVPTLTPTDEKLKPLAFKDRFLGRCRLQNQEQKSKAWNFCFVAFSYCQTSRCFNSIWDQCLGTILIMFLRDCFTIM